jgi:hypothetical protein
VFLFPSGILLTMMLRMKLIGATPIGITLQRFNFYTLASFGSNYSLTIPILAYVLVSN